MQNEVLAKAITGIDDELIVSAYMASGRPRAKKRGVWYGICVAACIVLICGAILLSNHGGGVNVFLYGDPVNGQTVFTDTRLKTVNVLSLPLEMVTNGDLTINAIDGNIEVYSLNSEELLCVGQFLKTRGSVNCQWTVYDPNTDCTYEIALNDSEVTLRLSYDKDIQNWILNKQ